MTYLIFVAAETHSIFRNLPPLSYLIINNNNSQRKEECDALSDEEIWVIFWEPKLRISSDFVGFREPSGFALQYSTTELSKTL